jgi:hypothetical protein
VQGIHVVVNFTDCFISRISPCLNLRNRWLWNLHKLNNQNNNRRITLPPATPTSTDKSFHANEEEDDDDDDDDDLMAKMDALGVGAGDDYDNDDDDDLGNLDDLEAYFKKS